MTWSFSNVVIPFRTKSTITCLECWNTSSKFWFHTKFESCLMRSQKGCTSGPSEHTQAIWLTCSKHDLSSERVLRIGKFNIASSMNSDGVTAEGVIWRPPIYTTSLQNWNLSLLSMIPFLHNEAGNRRCDKRLL